MTTMAPPPAAEALDVRTFRLGDQDVTALRQRFDEALTDDDGEGVLASLAGPVRRALGAQLSKDVEDFLHVDLGTTAVAGWRKHQDLLAAARATRARSGLTQCVVLADHTMTSTWTPRVEVLVAPPKAVATLTFSLQVWFTRVGLTATVTDARLTRLGGGSGTVGASLTFGGRKVLEREELFDASVSVPFGSGVPLLSAAESTDAPSVVASPWSGTRGEGRGA